MGTQNLNEVTGNEVFDNIISSLQLLHEYIQVNDDDLTFALFFGGVAQDNGMLPVNSSVGDLSNPTIFKAAVHSLSTTMKESDKFAKLIIAAYHSFQSDSNVKVLKFSVESPLDALMMLKSLVNEGNSTSILDKIPIEVLESIIDMLPPEFAKGFYDNDLCDNPNCQICNMKRKFNRDKGFPEIFDSPIFSKRTDEDKGN